MFLQFPVRLSNHRHIHVPSMNPICLHNIRKKHLPGTVLTFFYCILNDEQWIKITIVTGSLSEGVIE